METYNNPSYNPETGFIPPKIGQIWWKYIGMRTIGIREFRIAAEIINDNKNVGLSNTFVQVNALDKKDLKIGRNTNLLTGSSILYLLPKQKYIHISSFFILEFYYKKVYQIKISFPHLKWRDFSGISFPKAVISNDKLIKINGKHILLFNLTNLSEPKHSFQVNVGFYSYDEKLIGGAIGLAHWNIKPNVPKTMKIKLPFELPPDCRYIIQPYADTPFLRFFLKRKKTN